MADFKWSSAADWSGAIDAFNAADFNALANNGGKLSTATPIDNTSGKLPLARLSFQCVTSTWAVGAGGLLRFYLLPINHAGNYPQSNNGNTAADYPAAHYMTAIIGFRQATLAHQGVSDFFEVPAAQFVFYVVNQTGAALPGSSTNMTCKLELLTQSVA